MADGAGITAGLTDVNAIDDVNCIMAAAAIQIGIDLVIMTGMRAVLVSMTGRTVDIVRAAHGGGNDAVVGG